MSVSPVEASTMYVNVHTCFQPLTRCLQVTGSYVPSTGRGRRRVVQCVYSALVHVILWTQLSRFVFLFSSEASIPGTLVNSLTYFLTVLGGTYQCTAICLASSKHLHQLLEAFTEYHKHYGLGINLGKVRQVLIVLVAIIMSLALIQGVSNVQMLNAVEGTSLEQYSVPFNQLTGLWYILGAVFLVVCSTFYWSVYCLTWLLYFSITYCLSKELHRFNVLVVHMVDTPEQTDTNIGHLQKQHVLLSRVLSQSDAILTHLLFASTGTTLPTICFVLYGLIRDSLGVDEFVMTCAWGAIGAIAFCSSIIVAARINSKAHACLDDLIRADLTSLSQQSLQIISIFVGRLTGPPIGFTVYGLFTVDSSAILTVLGTLLTYAIVVLQLKPEDVSLNPAVISNSTS